MCGYPYGRVSQRQERLAIKPCGVWFSVEGEDDWMRWCCSEGFRLGALTFGTEIVLKDDANVLWIRTVEELDAFTREYRSREATVMGLRSDWIDWERVIAKYDGIIIPTYLWERRMSAMWYYGWDCASGCVWNTAAIKFYRPAPGHFRRWIRCVPKAWWRNNTWQLRYRWSGMKRTARELFTIDTWHGMKQDMAKMRDGILRYARRVRPHLVRGKRFFVPRQLPKRRIGGEAE